MLLASLIVSLTLIPPSPVSRHITLDVRAAVRNTAPTARVFDVSLYLDREAAAALLHRQKLRIAAHSATAVPFRWPLASHAGSHRLVLVARSGSRVTRTSEPVQVLDTPNRSTRTIDGAWAGIVHWSDVEARRWNTQLRTLTNAQWRGQIAGMHGLGMNIVVLEESFRNHFYHGRHNIETTGYQGAAFYPSRLFPKRMKIAAADPFEAILTQADRLGMHVFLPLGMYAFFDFTPGSLAWHKQVATELWQLYGHHRSIYGWYVAEEVCGNMLPCRALSAEETRRYRDELITFFRQLRGHCRALAPDKPILFAPNSHRITEAAGTWRELFRTTDILCPFGFHRMPKGGITGEQAAATLQRLADETGSHLWMDMEVFLFDRQGGLYPRPIDGLVSDLTRFPSFEKILCFQYPGLMNAPSASVKPGGDDTVRLYLDYQRYLRSRKEPLP